MDEQEALGMVMSSREQLLFETQRTRAHAAAVLRDLEAAKVSCEAALAAERRPDMIKSITGQSSLEVAIAETRKLIESLDRALAAAARQLDDQDRDALASSDGLEAVIRAGRLGMMARSMARVG